MSYIQSCVVFIQCDRSYYVIKVVYSVRAADRNINERAHALHLTHPHLHIKPSADSWLPILRQITRNAIWEMAVVIAIINVINKQIRMKLIDLFSRLD